jgi:O-antigen/teichoic acid export membrane protein
MSEPAAAKPVEGAGPDAPSETAVAVRNGIKLAASLVATWTVALVVRFQLPRHLGPSGFGEFNFADSFAAGFAVFTGLGVDMYIRREIPVRPEHASEFFGGVTVIRIVATLVLFAAMAGTLVATGRSLQVIELCLIFGATYALVNLNNSLAAMLQSSSHVGALAIVNVVAKLLWGFGLLGCLWLGAPFVVLAIPNLVAELLRAIVLLKAARSAVALRWRIDSPVVKAVLLASVPFFVNGIAISLVNRLDVSMLEFLSTREEVGWYSAANNIASLAMLLTPVLSWVLMPLFARTYKESPAEFFRLLRRSMEGLVLLAVPTTLVMGLGADLWIRVAFGKDFAPAAVSLRYLAPLFVATYLAMLLAVGLIILGHSWRLTLISLSGLAVQPLMILLGVRLLKGGGPGAAGAGTALGVSGSELWVAVVFLASIGRAALDARTVRVIVVAILAAVAAVGLHPFLASLGYFRLLLELALWTIVVLLLGGEGPMEAKRFVVTIVNERRRRGRGE